jgi:hypothetical protein
MSKKVVWRSRALNDLTHSQTEHFFHKLALRARSDESSYPGIHMRSVLHLLLFVSLSFAANTTLSLDLSMATSCPGDNLTVSATSSDGDPAPNITLRLVQHHPYQGLRALMHTNASGQAVFEITQPALYRIYPRTDLYDHADFYELDYPEMCPAPPPKQMELDVSFDCVAGLVLLNATYLGAPLESVFVRSLAWSSMTGESGIAALHLEEDDYFIEAYLRHFATKTIVFEPPCEDNSTIIEGQEQNSSASAPGA